MQDIEFTIENEKVYLIQLQTVNKLRTINHCSEASIKIAERDLHKWINNYNKKELVKWSMQIILTECNLPLTI